MPDPAPQLWHLHPADPTDVRNLTEHLGCPEPIAHLLASRGITTPAEADLFFHPQISHLHPPHLLLGMDRAVARIQQAVTAAEPILIYGDYDVDGTTATVLLKTAIDRIAPPGQPSLVTWHVPHRIREGYGIQGARLAEAEAAGIRLVISVDTGIRAFAAAAEARELGLDLIVTDHHLPDNTTALPEALAVINPAQPGCPYPFKHLCGAAVAFKLAHALLLAHAHTPSTHDKNPVATTQNHCHSERSEEPASLHQRLAYLNTRLLPSFLKLVAIATVADSVPLIGENRVLAALGLRELRNPVQPGLRELMRVAGLPPDGSPDRPPTATEVGFRIAPRINAAGRMDIADDVIELFLTRSPQRATELAEKLNQLNVDRRATERSALDDIEQHLAGLLATHRQYPAETLVFDHPDWHRGVLGILASRVVDRTHRPALVLTHQDDVAHGSGRSIPGFHLLDALTAAHAAGCDQAAPGTLFHRFGGHAHAVGFSLPAPHVALLRERLRAHGAPLLSAEVLTPPTSYDAEVPASGLTPDLCSWLDRCAPFGNGNPEPIFLTRSLVLASPPRFIKDRHICLQLTSTPNAGPLQAVGWSRSIDWPARARQLGLTPGTHLDLVYRLRNKCSQWFTGLELDLIDLRRSANGL